MAKGRPKQEERIKELETRLVFAMDVLESQERRIRKLEEHVPRGTKPYEPLFDHWPGLR